MAEDLSVIGVEKRRILGSFEVDVEPPLTEFIIATEGYLEPSSGLAEEQRYCQAVDALSRLGTDKLAEYERWLDDTIKLEEDYGIFGENGLSDVRTRFRLEFMSQEPQSYDLGLCA